MSLTGFGCRLCACVQPALVLFLLQSDRPEKQDAALPGGCRQQVRRISDQHAALAVAEAPVSIKANRLHTADVTACFHKQQDCTKKTGQAGKAVSGGVPPVLPRVFAC